MFWWSVPLLCGWYKKYHSDNYEKVIFSPPYLDVFNCAVSSWPDGRCSCFHRSCYSVMHKGLIGGQEILSRVYWVVLLCPWCLLTSWPCQWQCWDLAWVWWQEKFCLLQVKCLEKQTPNVVTGRRKIWGFVQAVCCCYVLYCSHIRDPLSEFRASCSLALCSHRKVWSLPWWLSWVDRWETQRVEKRESNDFHHAGW